MSHKYRNPSGFPENLPSEQIMEDKLKVLIRKNCESFGYVPLETSAVEYLETLSSKGEINKEIYTIDRALGEGEEKESVRALRFDLTVPMARYVAQHYGQLHFPFRRYQIQRVWRGERPQKGRYREFYQADIDVVANEKLPSFFDAEVVEMMQSILTSFNFGRFTIHINNRKVIQGILESYGISNIDSALRIIDKLDKVGKEAATAQLVSDLKIDELKAKTLLDLLDRSVTPIEVSGLLNSLKIESELFLEGKAELEELFKFIPSSEQFLGKVRFNLKIVRGLDYYTGSVFETTIDGLERYGSICSGGRYANLVGKFINRKLPGVGISLGLTRLLEIIKQEKIYEFKKSSVSNLLVGLTNEEQRGDCTELARKLRERNIKTEIYYSGLSSLGKQYKYQEEKNIPFFLFVDENGGFRLKALGKDELVLKTLDEVIQIVKS